MSASSCVIGAAVALRLKRSTVTAFELLILSTNALATRCTLGVMRGFLRRQLADIIQHQNDEAALAPAGILVCVDHRCGVRRDATAVFLYVEIVPLAVPAQAGRACR